MVNLVDKIKRKQTNIWFGIRKVQFPSLVFTSVHNFSRGSDNHSTSKPSYSLSIFMLVKV
uniref:Uncharacterized protein n=1 Tax=Arion vulgaris TaxID=1028688 RepID=A0A0B6Y5L6_9EUPU